MKRTNLELIQHNDFWENNNIFSIRFIVKKFIKEYLTLELCYNHYVKECDILRVENEKLINILDKMK